MKISIWYQRELKDSVGWVIVGGLVALFLSLFFSWQLGFFCLLFLATAWWVWDNPEGGFLLLIILAPILPMLKITQTIGTATLIKDVIILILFIRQFLWPLIRQTLPYRRAVLTAPIVCLSLWTLFETLRADSLILGILRARDIVLYVLLYFAIIYLPLSRDIIKKRLGWLLASVLVLLGLAIYQWGWAMDSAVLRFDPVKQIWIPRLSSILAHPSIFGQYMVSVSLLVVSMMLYARSKKLRLGWLLLWLIMWPFIWLTYSRAVWIGVLIGTGVVGVIYGYHETRKKIGKKSLARMGLGLIIIAVLGTGLLFKFTTAGIYAKSFIDPRYGSNEERLEFLARLIAPMTNQEALLGKGLGDVTDQNFRENNFGVYDIATGNSREVQLTKNSTLVDNQYLKSWVEMGLVGLLIYGWIYWRFLRAGLMVLPGDESRCNKVIRLWGVGFVAAFVIQALFIDIWDIWPTNAMFWIVAGLVGASATTRGIRIE